LRTGCDFAETASAAELKATVRKKERREIFSTPQLQVDRGRPQDRRDPKIKSASKRQIASGNRNPPPCGAADLLSTVEQRVQARFAAIGRVLMNDSVLGRFIER
jgi:hypothetical protein